MTELFNLAACKALHMFQPSPPKISIGIEIGQPPMNGGLSSIQESMNIGGEPHRLSYINSDEASLLKQLGGSGQPVNGVPAYFDAGEGMGGYGSYDAEDRGDADTGGRTGGMSADEAAGWDVMAGAGPQDAAAAQAMADVGSTVDFGGGAKGWSDEEEAALEAQRQDHLNRTWQPYGTPHTKFMSREDWEKLNEEERSKLIDTREPSALQSFLAHVFGGLVSGALGGIGGLGIGALATQFGKGLRGSPDTMSDADKEDPDQMGMREDPAQFDVPQDYEDFGEGDPLLKDPLKIKRPCAPGEVGWPECAEEEEEEDDTLTGMAGYLKQRQKREAQDPYKGQEEFYESIWGPDWRAILARRGNT